MDKQKLAEINNKMSIRVDEQKLYSKVPEKYHNQIYNIKENMCRDNKDEVTNKLNKFFQANNIPIKLSNPLGKSVNYSKVKGNDTIIYSWDIS